MRNKKKSNAIDDVRLALYLCRDSWAFVFAITMCHLYDIIWHQCRYRCSAHCTISLSASHLIIIIIQICLEAVDIWKACQIYSVDCVSLMWPILTIISFGISRWDISVLYLFNIINVFYINIGLIYDYHNYCVTSFLRIMHYYDLHQISFRTDTNDMIVAWRWIILAELHQWQNVFSEESEFSVINVGAKQ